MAAPPADSDKQNTGEGETPRAETFLARYPRKLKLGVLLAVLVLLAMPWLSGSKRHADDSDKLVATAVSGSEGNNAVVNASPAQNSGSKTRARTETVDAGHLTSEETANESTSVFMKPAPDPALSEDTPQGSLPRIAEDGRQPWQSYARPFNTNDRRPRVSIIVTDLGLSRSISDAAIDRLPPNVTLAFDVQSPVVGAWCARARQAGHETLLMLPMEPFDYPRSDPGPNTLLSNLPNSDNLQRLQWALMQATGYVGVTTLSGSRLTTDPTKITPMLDALHKRGLMVFDAHVAPHSAITDLARTAHIPVAVVTQRLDLNLSPAAIDETLNQIEQSARLNGHAVALAPPLPLVIDRLGPWIKQLARDGLVLAPLTAVAQ